jgi:hypothetical protein
VPYIPPSEFPTDAITLPALPFVPSLPTFPALP